MNEQDMTIEEHCKAHWLGRRDAFEAMLDAEDYDHPDYGSLYDYGLSFDYVPGGTFVDQPNGYFRYQLSWGGPSDELRVYLDVELKPYRMEYWFLDWFTGHGIDVKDDEIARRLWGHLSLDGDDDHLRTMITAATD